MDSFLDGCVWAAEAADAMETSINNMKHAHVCISLEIHVAMISKTYGSEHADNQCILCIQCFTIMLA